MELKSFFWDAAANSKPVGRWSKPAPGQWRVGNAGDVFNRDLIEYVYGATLKNLPRTGPRLLLVGSTVHRVLPGDVVCGVGHKGSPIPPAAETAPVTILGVRGPLTVEALREAGYDVSNIQFQYDPGLLVREMYADSVKKIKPKRNRSIFIPHYRERPDYAGRKDVKVIDIDCTPKALVEDILKAEHVYSSSLHGVVFAHALGRPVTLVAPLTAEPELKYRDYYASVGQPWETPGDLDSAIRSPKPTSPVEVVVSSADFHFPSAADLRERGILTD